MGTHLHFVIIGLLTLLIQSSFWFVHSPWQGICWTTLWKKQGQERPDDGREHRPAVLLVGQLLGDAAGAGPPSAHLSGRTRIQTWLACPEDYTPIGM